VRSTKKVDEAVPPEPGCRRRKPTMKKRGKRRRSDFSASRTQVSSCTDTFLSIDGRCDERGEEICDTGRRWASRSEGKKRSVTETARLSMGSHLGSGVDNSVSPERPRGEKGEGQRTPTSKPTPFQSKSAALLRHLIHMLVPPPPFVEVPAIRSAKIYVSVLRSNDEEQKDPGKEGKRTQREVPRRFSRCGRSVVDPVRDRKELVSEWGRKRRKGRKTPPC
jgi:hypothetical protein